MLMRSRYCLFICCLFITSIVGCTKYQLKPIAVEGLQPQNLITEEKAEAYVNRLYISLLGRKPTSYIVESEIRNLLNAEADSIYRVEMIEEILDSPEYLFHQYQEVRSDWLQDLDTITIREEFEKYRAKRAILANKDSWELYDEYLLELELLLQIPSQLEHSEIMLSEVHRRCTDNLFYDEINMGTENFLVALFTDLFRRYPSTHELETCKKIINGQEEVVLREAGESREELLDIIFRSKDYVEGQIRRYYLKFMKEEVDATQLAQFVELYQQSGNEKKVLISILSSEAYLNQ